jgi:hypothetical protein
LLGTRSAMARITISYRRDDSLDITGRIFDRLVGHFGREAVFRDIDNIPPGADFRCHIDHVLDKSDIVLAIVGPRWIGPDDEQRRLASPADPVRLEIETALLKNKPLIPVLVSRAVMPPPHALPDSLHDFAYRNAVQVDSGQDFDFHVGRLIRAMERILQSEQDPATNQADQGVIAAIEALPRIEPPPKAEPPFAPVAEYCENDRRLGSLAKENVVQFRIGSQLHVDGPEYVGQAGSAGYNKFFRFKSYCEANKWLRDWLRSHPTYQQKLAPETVKNRRDLLSKVGSMPSASPRHTRPNAGLFDFTVHTIECRSAGKSSSD